MRREQVTAAQAVAEMRAAGFQPLEPYPGRVVRQWRARCIICGNKRSVRLSDVRRGRRCGHQRPPVSAAAEELKRMGYKPLEPYPGSRLVRWRVKCLKCGNERHLSLKSLRATPQCPGKPPPLRVTAQVAEAELRAAGYEPLESYPGLVRLPWRARCVVCGIVRRPSVQLLRSGSARASCLHVHSQRPFHRRTNARDAEVELRAAGYEPLAPYPGGVVRPWRARCVVCGRERWPNLNAVRQGKRCGHQHPPTRPRPRTKKGV